MRQVSDDERVARAALSRVGEPDDAAFVDVVAALGAQEAYASIRRGDLESSRLAHWRTRLGLVDPARDLAVAARSGIRLVCPGDAEWPTQLEDLQRPPLALWVRGEGDLRLWALRSVAVVGARACTAYGEHVAAAIAALLAERGWTVVSGAAYGVDGAAHRGALAVTGRTVAVLACGVDVAYPSGHTALLRRIAAEGLVVSEVAPGCTVTKARFLTRNRVIAALTRGTVVVEAAVRSGALSTATRAGELNRHVMAVPGPVTSPMSEGCHRLVRQGRGSLVADGVDVLDLVGAVGESLAPEASALDRASDDLDRDTLRVLEALPSRRAAPVDKLVLAAGLAVPTVFAALETLQRLGLADVVEGRWRLADRARPPRQRPQGGCGSSGAPA